MSTKQITDLIRTIRKQKKLTQKEVANKLQISVAQYGHYETGHSEMTLSTFLKILEILRIEPKHFFGAIENRITKEDIATLKALVEQLEQKAVSL